MSPEAGALSEEDLAQIELVRELFRKHVDSQRLVVDIERATRAPEEWVRDEPCFGGGSRPRFQVNEQRAGGGDKRALATAVATFAAGLGCGLVLAVAR